MHLLSTSIEIVINILFSYANAVTNNANDRGSGILKCPGSIVSESFEKFSRPEYRSRDRHPPPSGRPG